MKCWNRNCQYENPFPDRARFCPKCGVQLLQECPYCHNDEWIDCTLTACPHCGKGFLRCAEHNIQYPFFHPRCSQPGCAETLVYESDVSIPLGLGPERLNCHVITKKNSPLTCGHMGARVSPMAVSDQKGYFWKDVSRNQCKLMSFRFDAGKPFWPENYAAVENFSLTGNQLVNFEISGFFIVTYLRNRILLHSVNDGGKIAEIPVRGTAYQAFVWKSRLYILEAGISAQTLVRYEYPFQTYDRLDTQNSGAEDAGFAVWPAYDGQAAFFADFRGAVLRLDLNSETVRRIYTLPLNGKIRYMALREDKLIYSMTAGESACQLHKLDLNSLTDHCVVTNAILETPEFSVYGESVYLCERVRNSRTQESMPYFAEYPLSDYITAAANQYRVPYASAVRGFYLLIQEGSVYILYSCRNINNNFQSVCCMNFQTGDPLGKPKQMRVDADIRFINIDNHSILSDLARGQFFALNTL